MAVTTPVTGSFSRRPAEFPPTPLAHIYAGFKSMLEHPLRPQAAAAWREYVAGSRQYRMQAGIFGYGKPSFYDGKAAMLRQAADLLAKRDTTFASWMQIAYDLPDCPVNESSLDQFSSSFLLEESPFKTYFRQIELYLGHDANWSDPRAALMVAINYVTRNFNDDLMLAWKEYKLPDFIGSKLITFAETLPQLYEYFEELFNIGAFFFGSDEEMKGFKSVSSDEIAVFTKALINANALRFTSTDFLVVTGEPDAEIKQNAFFYQVEPGVSFVLPMVALLTKLACDIKNTIRVVERTKPANPVHASLRFRKIPGTDLAFEILLSDNGKGVIVEELFESLYEAAKRFPNIFPPALRVAIIDWKENKNPFALENIPYQDLRESIFLLGVTSGMGSASTKQATGMGLWGTAALMLKLGAQIKIGVNTENHGFYQSIILPRDLSVAPALVESIARRYWYGH